MQNKDLSAAFKVILEFAKVLSAPKCVYEWLNL